MSNSESSPSADDLQVALDALTAAATGAETEIKRLRAVVKKADAKLQDQERLLSSIASGKDSPSEMRERLTASEIQNKDLLGRLEQGREAVDRMLAKLRFLEEKK